MRVKWMRVNWISESEMDGNESEIHGNESEMDMT